MSSPEIEHLSLETETDSDGNSTTDNQISTDDEITEDHEDTNPVGRAIEAIDKYLKVKSKIYPVLQSLRSRVSQLETNQDCALSVNTRWVF